MFLLYFTCFFLSTFLDVLLLNVLWHCIIYEDFSELTSIDCLIDLINESTVFIDVKVVIIWNSSL